MKSMRLAEMNKMMLMRPRSFLKKGEARKEGAKIPLKNKSGGNNGK